MGLGNGNPKEGDKGSNFNYELKVLQGLQCTCDQLKIIDGNTDDIEFILSSILTTLQASTEYEAKFTVDTCNGDTVYLEVRVWNPDTSTWGPITYYLPGSTTPVIPPGAATPGCLVYADPSAVLALILGAIQASNVILTDIETSVELIDNCVGTDGATAPANSFVIAGVTAGGVQQTVEVNASGHVNISDGGGSITVDGLFFQAIQPVDQVEKTGVSGYTAAITGVAATDVIIAPGVGLFTYVTQILVTNSDATVGTLVTIQTSSGIGLYAGYAAPAGGGFSVSFPVAIKMPIDDEKLQAICTTTGANVYVSASGYIAP